MSCNLYLEQFRNLQGRIVLDRSSAVNLEQFISGRKRKVWLEIDSGEGCKDKYLFKETFAHSMEDYAELIASELALQCGLKSAQYDLASYGGINGVVTKSFLHPGDTIISGNVILDFLRRINLQNDRLYPVQNCIDHIYDAFVVFGIHSDERKRIIHDLIKLWAFDGLILESDRNSTNWEIIRNLSTTSLAPIYDCASMARLNNNIEDLVAALKRGQSIYGMIDPIKFSLLLHAGQKEDQFLDNFRTFCFENDVLSDEIMTCFNQIDVSLALDKVQQKTHVELPYYVGFWVRKVIDTRLMDMNRIHQEEREHQNILNKKLEYYQNK